MKPDFDYPRDLDGNVVDRKHKFAMVSEREWKWVRTLAASCLTQAIDKAGSAIKPQRKRAKARRAT